MENRRNYYRILHIQPDAPVAIIKASYRTQMQKLRMHPDLGGDEWNASLLNEAYQVLSDPGRRRTYDKAYFGDRGKIPLMVRGDIDDAAGFEATDDLLDVFSTDKPPFVMPLLRPRVRKVDMKATD